MERIMDDQFGALLAWVERERAMERLIERKKLSPVEHELRRLMSLDRLLRDEAPS
jgi:hypothetical protein